MKIMGWIILSFTRGSVSKFETSRNENRVTYPDLLFDQNETYKQVFFTFICPKVSIFFIDKNPEIGNCKLCTKQVLFSVKKTIYYNFQVKEIDDKLLHHSEKKDKMVKGSEKLNFFCDQNN